MKTLTEAVKACGGVWPVDGPIMETGIVRGWYGDVDQDPDFIVIDGGRKRIHRPEFEAHAAELSGKPGWGEAPEWAEWLGQSSHGHWEWYESKPKLNDDHWNHSPHRGVLACYGTTLGDWRDTLERRPEGVADSVVPSMWMPDVNSECEKVWTSPNDYYRVKILGYDGMTPVGKWLDGPGKGDLFSRPQKLLGGMLYPEHPVFRPLKSDRERWVEAAVGKEIMYDDCGMDEVFGRIYDALKSGELPVPE